MHLSRRTLLATAASATAGTALAGCLGDDSAGESTPTDADDGNGDETDGGNGTDDGDGATVRLRSHPDHGDILVGPDELTLYQFDADTQGASESACRDDCVGSWPPLTVEGEPEAGEAVEAELSTFERDDGDVQVAANGWPLYYFAGDDEPGDASGQGVNDAWWVLGPDGEPKRDGDDGNDDSSGY